MNISSNAPADWKAWLPVMSLAFAAFIFNTTEFVPVGLLPDIAQSFASLDVAHAGLLITGYAWMVALMSLPLTIATAAYERRRLLMVLFGIFIGSHLLAAMAWNFGVLMLARMGIACAHAIFWSITIPLAVRLAPLNKKAKALGLMVTGSSLATVLGVPIGTLIGHQVGWRITFLCIAVLALLVIVALVVLLPKLPSRNAGSLKSLPLLLKRPALIQAYLLIAILVTGHFTAYTYITPFMRDVGGFSEQFVVLLLLLIGGGGIVGSVIFTRCSVKYPLGSLVWPIGLLLGCLVLLQAGAFSTYTVAMMCMVWGTSMTMIGLALQTKVLAVASDASDVAISMYSGIFNIGIGGGALVGSQVLIYSSVVYVGYAGAVFVAAALALCYFVSHRYWVVHSDSI